jgi:hypothetical protein
MYVVYIYRPLVTASIIRVVKQAMQENNTLLAASYAYSSILKMEA